MDFSRKKKHFQKRKDPFSGPDSGENEMFQALALWVLREAVRLRSFVLVYALLCTIALQPRPPSGHAETPKTP